MTDAPGGSRVTLGTARVEGADGRAFAMVGDILTLELPRAFAPGAPLRGVVLVPEREIPVEGRTVDSKRSADGTFTVRVRVVNMRRDDRVRLTLPAPG